MSEIVLRKILEIICSISIPISFRCSNYSKFEGKVMLFYSEKNSRSTTIVRITAKLKLQEFLITKNIKCVNKKFCGEGKCSVTFIENGNILMLSDANPNLLKRFVFLIERLQYGKRIDIQSLNENIKKIETAPLLKQTSQTDTLILGKQYVGEFTNNLIGSNNIANLFIKSYYITALTISPQLSNLVSLTITSMPFLSYIHGAVFDSLPKLESLDFSNNALIIIPISIQRCKNLRTINFSKNFLVNIPASVSKLSKLIHLDISNNCLRSLPYSLSQLRLDVIDVTGNQFNRDIYPPSTTNLLSLFEIGCEKFINNEFLKNKVANIPAILLAEYLYHRNQCYKCGSINKKYRIKDSFSFTLGRLAREVRGNLGWQNFEVPMNLILCHDCEKSDP